MARHVPLRGDAIDLTGKRFGSWTVLGVGPLRRFPSGQPKRLWHVRCDCGNERDVIGQTLRFGESKGCRECFRRTARARGRAQSRKVGPGGTIAGIAEAAGLKLTTVDRRWRRGWPLWALGLGKGKAPRGLGGSVDVRGRRDS